MEVIVVDNASKDGTSAWLQRCEEIRMVLNSENLGFSRACNQGARQAKGDFLVFLNPDTRVPEGSWETMVEAFSDPRMGAVGPLSNYVAGLQRLDIHWPESAGPLAQLSGDTLEGKVNVIAKTVALAYPHCVLDTKLLIGFCLMLPRKLYESLGGMDENLFLGNDDLDLSWRLKLGGYRLGVVPGAFVYHEGQKSFQTESKAVVDRLVQESTDALYRKLHHFYRDKSKIPSPETLWGISWFKPSANVLNEFPTVVFPPKLESHMSTENREKPRITWSYVILTSTDLNPEKEIRETLDTLPMQGNADVLILNRSSVSAFVSPGGDQVRKLDLGKNVALSQGLQLILKMAKHENLLLLQSGLKSSALVNTWLAHFQPETEAQAFSLRSLEQGRALTGFGVLALGCSKSWLRNHIEEESIAEESTWIPRMMMLASAPESEMPALTMRLEQYESITPFSEVSLRKGGELFLQYPETLRDIMQDAEEVVFAGTAVSPFPVRGPLKGIDLLGHITDINLQDVLVLRVTPDLIDELPQRFKNARSQAPQLKSLVTILDANQALGRPSHPKKFEVTIDVTPKGVNAALGLAGYNVSSIQHYPGFPGFQPDKSREGWSQINASPRSSDYRYESLVSIIILGFNQVEYTRKCIESIQLNVQQKVELILVDNGSHDGTWEFFQSIYQAKTLRNSENLGVSAGWNQGLRLAQGKYILILNNDTLLFPGTLENLVRLADSDPSIGIVGPRCNRIAGAQVVQEISYPTQMRMEEFTQQWHRENELGFAEYEWIKGVCMLIPKAAFQKIGFFDERFGKGNFEDDDYCLRARYHGYKTCIAHDSYIHHYGSISFGQEGIDWNALMKENERKFITKWQRGAEALNDVQNPMNIPSLNLEEWMRRGQKAYEAGQLAEADEIFNQVAAHDPNHAKALGALSVLAYHVGKFRDAVLLGMRSLMKDSNDVDTALNLLEALEALNGELSEVEKTALFQRFPNNPAFTPFAPQKASWTPVPSTMENWQSKIEGQINAGLWNEALSEIEIRVKQEQDFDVCFNYMGVIAMYSGTPQEALTYFGYSLDKNPIFSDALMNAFDAALASQNIPAIKVRIQTALQVDPRNRVALRMKHHLEKEGEAISVAGNYQELEEGAAILEKAESQIQEGQSLEALQSFLDAVEKRPSNPQALNGLGIIAFAQNRFDESFHFFEEAARLNSGDQDILINLWESARALRKEKEVLPMLQDSLNRNPDFFDVRNALAQAG